MIFDSFFTISDEVTVLLYSFESALPIVVLSLRYFIALSTVVLAEA